MADIKDYVNKDTKVTMLGMKGDLKVSDDYTSGFSVGFNSCLLFSDGN